MFENLENVSVIQSADRSYTFEVRAQHLTAAETTHEQKAGIDDIDPVSLIAIGIGSTAIVLSLAASRYKDKIWQNYEDRHR
jgi:hypothetical protein